MQFVDVIIPCIGKYKEMIKSYVVVMDIYIMY